jgi:DNA-binding transcriptional regulator/RsmH inhibitor MraZ
MSTGLVNRQPLGDFVTRCEDNGRIRLPSTWLHYFTHDLEDNKVFSTSLDGATIRIYPESIWRANLSLFEELSDQSPDVERILTLANHFGTESTLEAHGKILIKPELRNRLQIIGNDIVGSGKKGVIHVHRKNDHDTLIDSILPLAMDAVQNLTRLKMR